MDLEAEGCISPCQIFTSPRSATSSSDKIFFYKFFRDNYGIKLFSISGPFARNNKAMVNETEKAIHQKRPCFSNDPTQGLPHWPSARNKNRYENMKYYRSKDGSFSCVPQSIRDSSLKMNFHHGQAETFSKRNQIEKRSVEYGFFQASDSAPLYILNENDPKCWGYAMLQENSSKNTLSAMNENTSPRVENKGMLSSKNKKRASNKRHSKIINPIVGKW